MPREAMCGLKPALLPCETVLHAKLRACLFGLWLSGCAEKAMCIESCCIGKVAILSFTIWRLS
jgi:hypothetical protein